MRGTLSYTLPEEMEDFKDALNGSTWRAAMFEFNNALRNAIKHADLSEQELAVYEGIRARLYEVAESYDLTFN